MKNIVPITLTAVGIVAAAILGTWLGSRGGAETAAEPSDAAVKARIIEIMNREEEKGLPELRSFLEDETAPEELRSMSVHAIHVIRQKEGVPELAPYIRDPHEKVRLAVLLATLRYRTPESYDVLEAALRDESDLVRLAAVHECSELEDPRFTPYLQAAYPQEKDIVIRAMYEAILPE